MDCIVHGITKSWTWNNFHSLVEKLWLNDTHAYMLSCFSRVRFFVTLLTVAHQAPLVRDFVISDVSGILQARILEWVAIPSSRGSSWPRGQTLICLNLLHCRQILYPLSLGSPQMMWEVSVKLGNKLGLNKCVCGLAAKLCLTLPTPWTVAHKAPLSLGFSRQEFWSRLLFPSLEDLPDPGIKPVSPSLMAVLQVYYLPAKPPGKLLKEPKMILARMIWIGTNPVMWVPPHCFHFCHLYQNFFMLWNVFKSSYFCLPVTLSVTPLLFLFPEFFFLTYSLLHF